MSGSTAFQINMYPLDLPHVVHTLPHQLRTWADQVDRVHVTVDVHRSRSGRYNREGYDRSLAELRTVLADFRRAYPKLSVAEVDYSDAARQAVGRFFFGLDWAPEKAWDGGPFYSYFFGLFSAEADYVFHIDGDMLFGGGSQAWMAEAIDLLKTREDVLFAGPLPGPPHAGGGLVDEQGHPGREPYHSPAFRFATVSTRIFLLDMRRLKERIGALPLLAPTAIQRGKSHIFGNPPFVREAEVLLSHAMRLHKLFRVDLLGRAPGMWSLHPPFRSAEFIRALPRLIERIEAGDVPDEQRGDYNLNDSMFDWSSARAATAWPRRMARHARDIGRRLSASARSR